MASTKEIKDRIASVRDTQKITNAMYLIASTKLRKARAELDRTRPYFDALRSEIKRVFRTVEGVESRYFYPGDDHPLRGTYAYLVITADKGLAGMYNQNVLREAQRLLNEHADAKLFVVGEYGRQYFAHHQIPVERSFLYTAQNPTMQRAREISSTLLDFYDSGQVQKIFVIYTDMKNAMTEEAKSTRLLPFHRSHFSTSAKEKQEIERILAALSAEIAPYADQLRETVETLAELDYIFAKGMLSREMNAVSPKLNQNGYINIIRGRHPLIDREKVVPSNLWMGKDFTSLIITGPNTGGKTVTLKTVGLLTLMAQAGLQVPADLGTELAVFEQVFADIGDEQSIEQSLSTFSGHMTTIVSIMHEVTPDDLVLFDELGAGTDPTEGAALAQAILQRLLNIRVRTLATTHYSELKAFALSTKGVENASVEFDVETLRPTYRLSIGVPGKSNAFEISRRLGLPENLIDDAKKLLSSDSVRFEDVIANAEYHRQVAEREREIARQASAETVKLRDEAEKLRKQMEDQRENTIKKAKADARRIMEQTRRESESIIADLKRMKKEQQNPDAQVNAIRRRIENNVDNLSEGLLQKVDTGLPPKEVRKGDTVEILTIGSQGTVLAPANAKGEVEVQAGILKLKVNISQLRLVKQPDKPKPQPTSVHLKTGAMERTVRMECDVRGMALDEAIMTVDQYLDQAILAGMGEVSIIHGKGTGVLRSGIQQHLKHHMHVASCRLGVYGEGESGVTIVTLK